MDDLPLVIGFVHIVYSHARDPLIVIEDRLVDSVAIHAFATIFGQDGRMDIDNAFRVIFNEEGWDKPEKSCEDNVICFMISEQRDQGFFILKILFGNNLMRDVVIQCPSQDVCIRLVAQYQIHMSNISIREILYDLFCIGAAAGGEYGQCFGQRKGIN